MLSSSETVAHAPSEKQDARLADAQAEALIARLLAAYNNILPIDDCALACGTAAIDRERKDLSSAMRRFVLEAMPAIRALDHAVAADIAKGAQQLEAAMDTFCARAETEGLDLRRALAPFKTSLDLFRIDMADAAAGDGLGLSRRRSAAL